MFDQIAYEHGNDLLRAAAAYRRVPSRAHRAAPTASRRVTSRVRAIAHRPAAPIGCQA